MPKDKPNPFNEIQKKRKEEQEKIMAESVALPSTINNKKEEIKPDNKEIGASSKKLETKEDLQNKPEGKRKKESTLNTEAKTGRPKGKPYTKISLNVPDEYLELVNIAAGINFKGNTSSYIISLIEKDLKTNGKVYEQIKNIAK